MPVYKSTEYILKKRGGSYQFNVQVKENGVEKRIRQQFSTEDKAREAVERIIDRTEAGTTAVAPTTHQFSSPTLKKVYELVLANEWKGTRGERTATKNALDCLKELGETTPVKAISTERVDEMIRTFKDRGLDPATVRRKLAALGRILHYAAERHWLEALPLLNRKRLGKEHERQRYLSEEEEKQGFEYLRFIKKDVGADFFGFLIDTGLRLSEGVNLEWTNVEDEWVRVIQNKADFPRSVPATDRVKAILTARRAARPAGEKRVWHDMTVDRAQWTWGLMREHLKLTDDPDFVIHACRHTFASRLARAGIQLNMIKDLGGWKTLAMVLRYAHLCPDTKAEAIKQMENRRKIG